MKKFIKFIYVFFIMLLVPCLYSCDSTIEPIDEILNYDIEVNPRNDGTLDMKYHITWKVLDDSREGPLSWVKIGVPNKYVDEICRKRLDKVLKKGYNVGEISKYAYDSFMYEDYAEAYTEYRTKNLLKGG